MQPFGNLQHRMCGPQGGEFAELLVGPTGHCSLVSRRPPAQEGVMDADSYGGYVLTNRIISNAEYGLCRS